MLWLFNLKVRVRDRTRSTIRIRGPLTDGVARRPSAAFQAEYVGSLYVGLPINAVNGMFFVTEEVS